MSKYKVGDKFIVEIGHGTVDPLYGARYFIKGFNTLVFDDYGLESLEQVNGGPTLREAYDEGYEKGLRDALECASLKEYKAKQAEIKVGDEVKIDDDSIGVVTSVWDDRVGGIITVDGEEGKQGYVFNLIDKSRYVKTGRHYDIKSILEQLKGTDDE